VPINSGLFSSNTCEWETPQEIYNKLNQEFDFNIDVCATDQNTKCKRFFSPTQDGLLQKWEGVCWMNPPYGVIIKKWMKKAYLSSLQGATVVCLIPSRTDTSWWHDYVMKGEIRFIRGRLKFSGHKWNAPFPSARVIFKSNLNCDKKHKSFEQTGLF